MDQIISFAQKALILNKKRDSILVVKYLVGKYLPDKVNGKLTLPGGQIEFGEEPDEGIIREVREETGVTIKPGLPFYVWTWKYDKEGYKKQVVAVARLASYLKGSIREPTDEKETKLEKARWIKLKEIKLEEFIWDERPAIKKFLAYQRKNPFEITQEK